MPDTARSEIRSADARPRSRDRGATASTPPDRPSARAAPRGTFCKSAAATRPGSSLELEFLELSIAHQALETLLDEFLRALVGDRAKRVGESFLQALSHARRIAMCAAEGLADGLVDQAESLQPACGDAERLRGLRRLIGALPQDR